MKKHDPSLWPHCITTCTDFQHSGCGVVCQAATCPVELHEQRLFNEAHEEEATQRRAFSEEDARNAAEYARRQDPYRGYPEATVAYLNLTEI